MEHEGSLPQSQQPTSCSYTEPHQISPWPQRHFLMIHFNIIFRSKPGFSKWSLSLKFSHKNPVCTSPIATYVLHAEPILLCLIT